LLAAMASFAAAAVAARRPLASRFGFPTALTAARGGAPLVAPLAAAASPLFGPAKQDARGVARVRINRFTGVRAIKVGAPKTEWQINAEKEFLAMRAQIPKKGYVFGFTDDDVRHLSPEMRKCLSLRCANSEGLSIWRKQQLIKQFQRRPFDTNSHPVRIAVLTEKIMRLRAHLLRNPGRWGHQSAKISMAARLSKRQKSMKSLYKSDYVLYKHVCQELGIRCVRFAVPGSKDPSKMVNPQAVDGDRARFLIRQRLYHAKFRPREMRDPRTNQLIRYTRHPMEPVPESHGKAVPVPQQVSRAWPYGVRNERVAGKQIVYNPTAAGTGFWPAGLGGIGGPIQD